MKVLCEQLWTMTRQTLEGDKVLDTNITGRSNLAEEEACEVDVQKWTDKMKYSLVDSA